MCLSKFGDASRFCDIFSKDKSVKYIMQKGQDYMVTNTNAPTMITVRNAYGDKVATSLLATYVLDMVNFFGLGDKATDSQIETIANLIITKYHYLKITEIMHCFYLMMSSSLRDNNGNDRSKMFGTFNGEAIMDCFDKYLDIRNSIIDRANAEKKKSEYEDMYRNAASPEFVKELLNKTIKSGNNELLKSVAEANGWIETK